MQKYKKLDIDFEIPEEIEQDINDLVDYVNKYGSVTADCYRADLNNLLNGCDTCMTDEQILLLRNYYVRGKMWKTKR